MPLRFVTVDYTMTREEREAKELKAFKEAQRAAQLGLRKLLEDIHYSIPSDLSDIEQNLRAGNTFAIPPGIEIRCVFSSAKQREEKLVDGFHTTIPGDVFSPDNKAYKHYEIYGGGFFLKKVTNDTV